MFYGGIEMEHCLKCVYSSGCFFLSWTLFLRVFFNYVLEGHCFFVFSLITYWKFTWKSYPSLLDIWKSQIADWRKATLSTLKVVIQRCSTKTHERTPMAEFLFNEVAGQQLRATLSHFCFPSRYLLAQS